MQCRLCAELSLLSSCLMLLYVYILDARCFTFGIGTGASSYLVNGIAEAGKGTAEFVKGDERLQPKVSFILLCVPHSVCSTVVLCCPSMES